MSCTELTIETLMEIATELTTTQPGVYFMYEISRLITAIISRNDAARPFYNLIATLEDIPYEDAKKRVTEEVTDFMKKNYRIQKHFDNSSNGNSLSMDKYLKDKEVLMEIVSFIINRFAKDVNSLHELIKVIHES